MLKRSSQHADLSGVLFAVRAACSMANLSGLQRESSLWQRTENEAAERRYNAA